MHCNHTFVSTFRLQQLYGALDIKAGLSARRAVDDAKRGAIAERREAIDVMKSSPKQLYGALDIKAGLSSQRELLDAKIRCAAIAPAKLGSTLFGRAIHATRQVLNDAITRDDIEGARRATEALRVLLGAPVEMSPALNA